MNLTALLMAIFILLVVTAQTCFFIVYFDKMRSAPDTRPESIKKIEKENPGVPPYNVHFAQGHRHAWALIRMSLFQMYMEGELLDYATLEAGILEKLKTFDNQEHASAVSKKLDEFITQLRYPKTQASSESESEF